jgi:flagellar biosynthetic protein FliR
MEYVVFFTLVLTRVGTFVAVMPLFSGRGTPRIVRVGLAMALAVFWVTTLQVPQGLDRLMAPVASSWVLIALTMMREMVLGAIVGLSFALFLAPARIAGEFVAQQVGLGQSLVLGPAGDAPTGPLTAIFETLAGLVFLELNMHHVILVVLHASFAKFPLGGTTFPIESAGVLLHGVASAEAMGVMLAGPLGLCMFLITVVLALMARVAPQLNIYSIGFTLQTAGAIVFTIFLLPDMIQLMGAVFERMKEYVAG